MSIKSEPYFWVECDAKGCDARTPGDDYECTAWGDEEQALSAAADDDWTVTDAGEHYCRKHHRDGAS